MAKADPLGTHDPLDSRSSGLADTAVPRVFLWVDYQMGFVTIAVERASTDNIRSTFL